MRARALVSLLAGVLLAALAAPYNVAAVEELPEVPNDPLWAEQWALADSPGVAINLLEGWRYGRGEGVVIAVLDSGVIAHPEFAGRMLPGYDFVSNPAVANDGGGRDSNPTDPGDWVTREEVASGDFGEKCKVSDSVWHGTHVAGIALAAANNGKGIAGVAPLALLLPVRVVGKCGGSSRDLTDGLRWAAGLSVSGVPDNGNPADVINISLGGEQSCSASLQRAVEEVIATGAMIVVAVGNEAVDASLYAPANCFGTVTVGAVMRSGTYAWYSNTGAYVDLSAPGGDVNAPIISSVDRGRRGPIGSGYAALYGTSMAAPHLAGVLAIARGYDPQTPSEALLEVLFANLAPFADSSRNPQNPYCSAGGCGIGVLDAGIFLAALEARAAPSIEQTLPAGLIVGASVAGEILVDGMAAEDVTTQTPEICEFSGGVLTGLTRGVCTLSLRRPGTATVKPIDVQQSISVTGLAATITHQLPISMRLGQQVRLHAAVDSGGVLTYRSRTPEICKVGAKGLVTPLGRGECVLRIRAAAAGQYDAARLTAITRVRRL